MARIDHILSRRAESPRKAQVVYVKNGPGRRKVSMRYDLILKKDVPNLTAAVHKQGDSWWRSRFADLVERRNTTSTTATSGRE